MSKDLIQHRNRMKQLGLSISSRDEIFSLLELAYQDLVIYYIQLCPTFVCILSHPDINKIAESLMLRDDVSFYISEDIEMGHFNVNFVSLASEKFELPLAVMLSEKPEELCCLLDQLFKIYNFPDIKVRCHAVHSDVVFKYFKSKVFVNHDSIYLKFLKYIEKNFVRQINLRTSLQMLRDCTTLEEFEMTWENVRDELSDFKDMRKLFKCSTRFHNENLHLVYNGEMKKLSGKDLLNLPVDNIILSIYYTLENAVYKFIKTNKEFPSTAIKVEGDILTHVGTTIKPKLHYKKYKREETEDEETENNTENEETENNTENEETENSTENHTENEETENDSEIEEQKDIISLKSKISTLYLTIIEDAIVGSIKNFNYHLSSWYLNDVNNIIQSVAVIPSNKIILKVLHTNAQSHWVLGVIKGQNIYILDSLGKKLTNQIEIRRKEFNLLYKFAYLYIVANGGVPANDWNFYFSSDCPQQQNAVDCGLYVIYYAISIINSIPFQHPPSSRGGRDHVVSIIEGKTRPILQNLKPLNESIVNIMSEVNLLSPNNIKISVQEIEPLLIIK